MKYTVIFEQDPDSWGAHVPDLPGCVAAAKTLEEVTELIREAIELHIEGLREENLAIPLPSSHAAEIEVSSPAA